MPDPRDGQCGKMSHYCRGGGGGEWAQLKLTDALPTKVAADCGLFQCINPFQVSM